MVPQDRAWVSVFDRSFLYGDGLFETIRVAGGKPFLWREHLRRLGRGAKFLGIRIPFTSRQLRDQAAKLISRNRLPDSLLRITLSRGVGRRGYSPAGADSPTLVMTLHPAPLQLENVMPQWTVITAAVRLPAGEALAQFKTCNKLAQIVARSDADAAGADEALLVNTNGEAVEGAGSNLFWIARGRVLTPPLESGILAGVTRQVVLDLCKKLGISARQAATTPKALAKADGVFLSLSSMGIVEVVSLDGRKVCTSPVTAKLRGAYARLISQRLNTVEQGRCDPDASVRS
jgi:aminodeoxychorismate lyase